MRNGKKRIGVAGDVGITIGVFKPGERGLGKVLEEVREAGGEAERGKDSGLEAHQLLFQLNGVNLVRKRRERDAAKRLPGSLHLLQDLLWGNGGIPEGSIYRTNLETDGGKLAGIEAGEGAVTAGIAVARLAAAAARREGRGDRGWRRGNSI